MAIRNIATPSTSQTPKSDAPALQRSDIPPEAVGAIRVKVGDTIYFLPIDALMAAYSDDNAPDFITGKGITGKAAALRSLLKGGLALAWPMVTEHVKAINTGLAALHLPPLPLPDLKTRHKDGLQYFVQYGMAVSLAVLCSLDWEATSEPVGSDARYVRLAGLSSPNLDALKLDKAPERLPARPDDPDN